MAAHKSRLVLADTRESARAKFRISVVFEFEVSLPLVLHLFSRRFDGQALMLSASPVVCQAANNWLSRGVLSHELRCQGRNVEWQQARPRISGLGFEANRWLRSG